MDAGCVQYDSKVVDPKSNIQSVYRVRAPCSSRAKAEAREHRIQFKEHRIQFKEVSRAHRAHTSPLVKWTGACQLLRPDGKRRERD
jgi:hypothetical protein